MPHHTISRRRILVVEDDYLLATELARTLTDAGAQVLGPVPSVTKGMTLIAQEQVDAAVLDVNLGDETSLPIADELLRRNVPFLFATGYDIAAIPDRHRAAPRSSKPVDLHLLRALVATAA